MTRNNKKWVQKGNHPSIGLMLSQLSTTTTLHGSGGLATTSAFAATPAVRFDTNFTTVVRRGARTRLFSIWVGEGQSTPQAASLPLSQEAVVRRQHGRISLL